MNFYSDTAFMFLNVGALPLGKRREFVVVISRRERVRKRIPFIFIPL